MGAFGEALRILLVRSKPARMEGGWPSAKLAEEIDVTPGAVSRWITGKALPVRSKMKLLVERLELDDRAAQALFVARASDQRGRATGKIYSLAELGIEGDLECKGQDLEAARSADISGVVQTHLHINYANTISVFAEGQQQAEETFSRTTTIRLDNTSYELLGHGPDLPISAIPGMMAPQRAVERPRKETSTNRREASGLIGRAALGVLSASSFSSCRADGNVNGNNGTLAALREITGKYRKLEGETHAKMLLPLVREHYRFAQSLVTDSLVTDSNGWAALSEIAGFLGWLAWDTNETGAAREAYLEAVQWARQAGEPLLTGYMLGSLGHFVVETGNAKYGLKILIDAAESIPEHVQPAPRAWALSLLSLAQASNETPRDARASLSIAESLSSARSEQIWPFVFAFDEAKSARWRAQTLRTLGEHDLAIREFREIESLPWSPKQKALGLVGQAVSLAALDRIEEASDYAERAFTIGSQYRSERVLSKVVSLRRSLPTSSACLRTLDERLQALYATER